MMHKSLKNHVIIVIVHSRQDLGTILCSTSTRKRLVGLGIEASGLGSADDLTQEIRSRLETGAASLALPTCASQLGKRESKPDASTPSTLGGAFVS